MLTYFLIFRRYQQALKEILGILGQLLLPLFIKVAKIQFVESFKAESTQVHK